MNHELNEFHEWLAHCLFVEFVKLVVKYTEGSDVGLLNHEEHESDEWLARCLFAVNKIRGYTSPT